MLKNLGIFIGVIAILMIIGMIINFIRFVARMMINIFIFSFGCGNVNIKIPKNGKINLDKYVNIVLTVVEEETPLLFF